MSHSCSAQKGPAITCPSSSTRIPSSAAARRSSCALAPLIKRVPIVNASTTVFMSRGPVAFFTINRPEAGNAMTWAMYDALVDACERVDAAPDLRAFVIRAAGATFCTGTDISQFTVVLDARGRPRVRAPPRSVRGADRARGRADDRPGGRDRGRRRLRDRAGVRSARVLAGGPLRRADRPHARQRPVVRELRAPRRALRHGPGQDDAHHGRIHRCRRGGGQRRRDAAGGPGGRRARRSTIWPRRSCATLRSPCAPRRRHWDGWPRERRQDAGEIADLVADCYASADFREGVSAFLSKRPPKFTGR